MDNAGLELSRFINPPTISDHGKARVNALGYLRVMFTVEDIDEDGIPTQQAWGCSSEGTHIRLLNMAA